MEKFEVHILGCGSALPTTRHFATSQVVNIREKLFMIDCGEGAQMQLRKSKLKFTRLNHIFISHLHGDHCFGLMGLISTFGMLGRTATLYIHCHAELERLLTPQLDFFCKGMSYKVVFQTFDPGKAAFAAAAGEKAEKEEDLQVRVENWRRLCLSIGKRACQGKRALRTVFLDSES